MKITVKAEKDFTSGQYNEVVITKGEIREVEVDLEGYFWTLSNKGLLFGPCKLSVGWVDITNKDIKIIWAGRLFLSADLNKEIFVKIVLDINSGRIKLLDSETEQELAPELISGKSWFSALVKERIRG